MRIFKLSNYPEICNEIRYDITDGALTSLEFVLGDKIVLQKLAQKLSGAEIQSILKNFDKITKSAPFMSDFLKELANNNRNINIKTAIRNLHNK